MSQRAIDGEYIYFVTTNVHHRRWFFVTPQRATRLGQAIQTCCRLKNFDLLAYCILPNHVHLLVRKPRAGEHFGDASTAQRTLERARCGGTESSVDKGGCGLASVPRGLESTRSVNEKNATNAGFPDYMFLFPHRRLSSRRCDPVIGYTLSDLMQSIKGTFSRTLPTGKFWQHRSNFRIVEHETYLRNVIEYIRYNYRKMDLPERYGQPPFGFINEGSIQQLFQHRLNKNKKKATRTIPIYVGTMRVVTLESKD